MIFCKGNKAQSNKRNAFKTSLGVYDELQLIWMLFCTDTKTHNNNFVAKKSYKTLAAEHIWCRWNV